METLEIAAPSAYELERHKPMPSTAHAIVQTNLVMAIGPLHRSQFRLLSEISLEFEDAFYVPDLAIYPRFEFDVAQDVVRRTDAPLATVEILSPTQALQTLIDKTEIYFRFGAKSCWIVLPAMKAVAVYYQSGKYEFFTHEETLTDRHLGITLPLAQVFE
jgi:Uma2 family endonuclease